MSRLLEIEQNLKEEDIVERLKDEELIAIRDVKYQIKNIKKLIKVYEHKEAEAKERLNHIFDKKSNFMEKTD